MQKFSIQTKTGLVFRNKEPTDPNPGDKVRKGSESERDREKERLCDRETARKKEREKGCESERSMKMFLRKSVERGIDL